MPPSARLITIPISHYCEKARWALEWADVEYREERHIQGVHRIAARRAGGGNTVPVLVTATQVLAESADIVAFADDAAGPDRALYPDQQREQIVAFERQLDAELGPHARRLTYFHLLPAPGVVKAYNNPGVPAWERRAFAPLYPLLARALARYLGADSAGAAASEPIVRRMFDDIARRLGDRRPYLFGDAFTAADLTFAALAAAVLVPVGYGVPLPQPDLLPPRYAALVDELRDHPAGRFALRMYRDHRRVRT